MSNKAKCLITNHQVITGKTIKKYGEVQPYALSFATQLLNRGVMLAYNDLGFMPDFAVGYKTVFSIVPDKTIELDGVDLREIPEGTIDVTIFCNVTYERDNDAA